MARIRRHGMAACFRSAFHILCYLFRSHFIRITALENLYERIPFSYFHEPTLIFSSVNLGTQTPAWPISNLEQNSLMVVMRLGLIEKLNYYICLANVVPQTIELDFRCISFVCKHQV